MTLLLSLMSVYAIMSFLVAQRTREIGVQVALAPSGGRAPARRGPIGAATRMGAGDRIHARGAPGAGRRVLPIPLPGGDPLVAVGVVGFLIVCCLIACWVPTRRALALQPIDALRCE